MRDLSRRTGWQPRWLPGYNGAVCWVPQEAEGDDWCDMCSGFYWQDDHNGLNGPYGSADDAYDAYQGYIENFG